MTIRYRFLLGALVGVLLYASVGTALATTRLHYAANHNFDSSGNFLPGRVGFNLADVSGVSTLNALPAGVKGLVWIGQCNGVTSAFVSAVTPFIGNAKLWGFYLFDDAYSETCDPAHLKAESDWIHAKVPGAKVFVELADGSAFAHPSYAGYNPATTGADYFGIAPYPCRSELNGGAGGCDYAGINRAVAAATAAGIPKSAIIPIYQTFGGGNWLDDEDGRYLLPTAAQEQQILVTWDSLVPSPAFDYAYSWGSQNSDIALESSTALQAVFTARNASTTPDPSPIAFSVGAGVKTKADVYVRSRPTTNPPSKRRCTQPAGAIGKVTAGPQTGSGLTWWNVAFETRCYGWVPQGRLSTSM